MAATLYVDTSLLMSAFSNEPDQALALKVLQAPQWTRVCVSDWTLAEFACAVQAKVMRGDTPAETAYAIHQTIKTLLLQGALHQIAVLRGDYATVQRVVTGLTCLIRAGGALHLAVAVRSSITHFASFDLSQRVAAGQWLKKVQCVPNF